MEDWGAVRDRLADQARDLERRALRERSSAASLVNDHEGAEGAGEEATLYDQLADKLSREAADIRAALERVEELTRERDEARAEVARLEGLILEAEPYINPEVPGLWTEIGRIRAQREEGQ